MLIDRIVLDNFCIERGIFLDGDKEGGVLEGIWILM